MITADADGVPFWHVLGAIGENICNQTHAGPGWENVCSSSCVLLEYVVLNSPHELVLTNALLFGNNNVHRQEHCRRRVNSH